MISKLKKIIKISKNYLNNVKSKSLYNKKIENSDKIIFLDLIYRSRDIYYPCLIYQLIIAKYLIIINSENILFVGSDNKYFKNAFDNENVLFLSFRKICKYQLKFDYIYDMSKPKKSNLVKRYLRLNEKYYDKKIKYEENIFVPIPMHPDHYISNNLNYKIDSNRNKERKIKIFFSGNTNKNSYDDNCIKTGFNILSRYEIINYLKTSLDKRIISDIKSLNDLTLIKNSGFNGVVINDWSWEQVEANKAVRIDSTEWFEYLGISEFFICCPGTIVNFGFNLYEALSVGVIPLIEKNNAALIRPELKNNINCITFNDLKDLSIKIDYLLNMPSKEIKKLSENVKEYFNENVDPICLGLKIEKLDYGYKDLYIFLENNSIPFILDRR